MKILQKWGFPVVAVCLMLLGTGCSTEVSGSGQYYACAPASVGDADERCREGFTCREVGGNAACVPEEEADQFPPLTDGDAGMDADTTDAQDTQDAQDAEDVVDMEDSRQSDAEDGNDADADADINCDAASLSLEYSDEEGQLLNDVSPARAGDEVFATVDGNQPWMSDASQVTSLSIRYTSWPTGDGGYPSWVELTLPDSATFNLVTDSGRWVTNFVPHAIGSLALGVTMQGPEDCEVTVEAELAVEPFSFSGDRCVYVEHRWADVPDSSLTIEADQAFLPDNFEETVSADSQNKNYKIGDLSGEEFSEQIDGQVNIDRTDTPNEFRAFVRIFSRLGSPYEMAWDGVVQDAGATPSTPIGGFTLTPQAIRDSALAWTIWCSSPDRLDHAS